MSIDTTSKKIIELEVELKKLKKKLSKEKSKKDDRFKLLDLFGSWEGEIETFLTEFYRRRERKGRANERLSP
jgi:hypothetical protein